MKKSFVFILLLGAITCGFSQKNSLSISHTTVFSKLNAHEGIASYFDRNHGIFDKYYISTSLDQPFITSTFTFRYHRYIHPKWDIMLWGRKLVRGLRSSVTYNLNHPIDLDPNFGGFSLTYRMDSFETGVGFNYTYFNNKALHLKVGIGSSFDVYQTLELELQNILKPYGVIRHGGISKRHYFVANGTFLERYQASINRRLYRMSNYISSSITYRTIIKGVSIIAVQEFGLSTPLKTENPAILAFLPDGWITSVLLEFGLQYTF